MRTVMLAVLAAMAATGAMAQGLQPAVVTSDTSFEWDMPTTLSDGSPLTEATGAKLYLGLATRNYTAVYDVGEHNTATATNLLWDTMYYAAVTAYNVNGGQESVFSDELAFVTPKPPPMPPTGAHTVQVVVTVDVYIDGQLVQP